MTLRNTGRLCVAAVLAFGLTALLPLAGHAQEGTSGATASASQERATPEQQVTLTGCIQSETEYRRAKDAGRGGAAGTGVGAANEFVLANASMASSSSGATGTTGTPTGTTGTAATTGTAYELTGANESKAAQHVGKRVEISGKLKAAEVAASGKPTGGATAGTPPEGIEVAGQDLKLREVDVTTIREVSGSCPSM